MSKKTRGYIDGCFDLMHSGHFNAIRQAKSVCDVLIVGIHSDDEIAINKAPPVMKQAERYALLDHIKWIDEVIYDVPYSPTLELLEKHNIDFVIHGDDMPLNSEGKCAYDEIIAAGKMKIIKRTEGVSTTDLVGRILLLSKEHLGSADVKTKSSMLLSTRRLAEFSSRRAPTAQDKILYMDGGYDMFHVGHASTLKKAKEMGTFLTVGVFDDDTVHKMKGANFPIMNLYERVLNVCACKWVDEVIIGAPLELTEEIIRNMNISLVVEGTRSGSSAMRDSTIDQVNEVPKRLGIFQKISSDWGSLNIQQIANRIIENRAVYLKRNAKKVTQEEEFYKQRAQDITEA